MVYENQNGTLGMLPVDDENKSSPLDKLAIMLLALCPILQHYKGIFINLAVSVFLLLFPYVAVKFVKKRYIELKYFKIALPLVVFYAFQVIDHGTSITEAGQAVVVAVYLFAITGGCFNTRYFIRVITCISIVACICIIIQYICYYLFRFHLQIVPTSLLLERNHQWIMLAKTGRYSITGKMIKFYRPSAFFLEPSHMFIYMFTPLTISMLSSDNSLRNRRISFLLAIGMILTTSGMGILTTILLYVAYVSKTNGTGKRFSLEMFFQPKNVLKMVLFLAIGIVIYLKVPFVRNSVDRIFSSGNDYSNAVSGRLDSGWNLIKTMHDSQLIIGVQDSLNGVTASMSGLDDTMFQYGIIGVILSYVFYVRGLFKLKNEFACVALIIIAVSLFSQHTHSTFFIIYETFVFTEGYKVCENMELGNI